MLKNYFKVALRTQRRNKGYTAINVGGLAVGLAACFAIGLWVRGELSYDRFHEKAERIRRVTTTLRFGDNAVPSVGMPAPLGPALVRQAPSVKRAVRFKNRGDAFVGRLGEEEKHVKEDRFFFAGSAFFEVFSFPLLKGNAQTALDAPYSIVLTEETAEKYFPDENPLGQTLTLADTLRFTVTGVAEEPPVASSIQFDFLASFSTLADLEPKANLEGWGMFSYTTYLLLRENAALDRSLQTQVRAVVGEHMDSASITTAADFGIEALTDVHFSSNNFSSMAAGSGDWRYVWVFSSIALLILLAALFNYAGLATARATQRAKEVGVRRAVGAGRWQVARQLLGEAVLMSLAAGLLALGLVRLSAPVLEHFVKGAFPAEALSSAPFLLAALGAVLAAGLLAGAYPAVLLSGFSPAGVLAGRGGGTGRSGATLRKVLVTFQFSVSVALAVGTLIIWQQLDYVRSERLGLSAERVAVVPLRGSAIGGSRALALKRELLDETGVQRVTVASAVPAGGRITGFTVKTPEQTDEEKITTFSIETDGDLLETFGLELTAGRDFGAGTEGASVILNETAVERLGLGPDPLGKTISYQGGQQERTVIGVVNDFQIRSLRKEIGPAMIQKSSEPYAGYLAVRFGPGDPSRALSRLEATGGAFAPDQPLDYFFADERFADFYRAEGRLMRLFAVFAGLAVFIACLGLFGLAAFAAERRRKEIAVRKTFGASGRQLVALLSKDFLKLVGVGFVIAAPLAYFAMQRWLEGFAYRIELGPLVFLAAGALALVVALTATSTQALRAARTNPAQALRDE